MSRCPEVSHHACRLSGRNLRESPGIPHPSGHGWTLDTAGVLSIHWMNQLPAPQALLELVSCGCTTGCATRRCTCKAHGMPCTDVCQCSRPGCKNVQRTRDGADEDDLTGSENEGDARLTSDEESWIELLRSSACMVMQQLEGNLSDQCVSLYAQLFFHILPASYM